MAIEEPVLPEWMQEEDEENVPLSMKLRQVKKERAKRARSSTTKGKSPAKKKQKKVSSEEESDEPEKVSMEVLSEEEEEEQAEEEGSSSDKTDIQAESPPAPEQTLPQQSEPSTHTHNIPKTPQSKQPSTTQPQPEKQPPQQLPSQEQPSEDVVTSGVAANIPENQPTSPTKKLRVKSVAKKRTLGRKARQELPAVSEETSIPDEVTEGKREKLPIKKKTVAPKGKPATATSAAFVAASVSEGVPAAEEENAADLVTSAEKEAAARLVELQASKENEKGKEQVQEEVIDAGDASTDVITSQEPEVEKTQVDPKEPASAMKAWEEAKKRIAEASTREPQTTEVSAATSTMAASDETTAAGEVGGEKKKKGKKKNTARPELPPRQSGRLRSGALNK